MGVQSQMRCKINYCGRSRKAAVAWSCAVTQRHNAAWRSWKAKLMVASASKSRCVTRIPVARRVKLPMALSATFNTPAVSQVLECCHVLFCIGPSCVRKRSPERKRPMFQAPETTSRDSCMEWAALCVPCCNRFAYCQTSLRGFPAGTPENRGREHDRVSIPL